MHRGIPCDLVDSRGARSHIVVNADEDALKAYAWPVVEHVSVGGVGGV